MPGGFFPTNPDLANMLGRMDLDFENFYFVDFLSPEFLDFQVPRSPDPHCRISKIAGPETRRVFGSTMS